MGDSTVIDKLPVADPQTILRALAQYAQKFSLWSVERFEVTLLMRSGHVLTGKAARLGRDLDGDCLLLYQGNEKDPAIVYVRLADVIGVRLNDPQIALRAFSERVEKVRTGQVPTRLQIKRDIERLSQELTAAHLPRIDCKWETIGETPDEQFNVVDMLNVLPGLIRKVNADKLGTEALKKVSSVTMRNGQGMGLQATVVDKSLEITFDFRRTLPDPLEPELQKTMEAAL